MLNNFKIKTSLFVLTLALIGLATTASSNSPFAQNDLNSNTIQSMKDDGKKCGEGKCGDKSADVTEEVSEEVKSKCGEGKCGDKSADVTEEASEEVSEEVKSKCGEGKCGDKKTAKKTKCGEGKCG